MLVLKAARATLPALLTCLLVAAVAPALAAAATFTVDTPVDLSAGPGVECGTGEECSLRVALEKSNASSAVEDTILFDETVFEGQSGDTIQPASVLPAITDPVTINGGTCAHRRQCQRSLCRGRRPERPAGPHRRGRRQRRVESDLLGPTRRYRGPATQTLDGGTSELSATAKTPPDPPSGCPAVPSACPPPPSPDTTKPKVTIKKAPKARSTSTTAKFKFVANEAGSKFKCKLDKGKFKQCKSPKTYKHLKPGKHVFKLKATDAAGNVSKVLTRKFTVLE